MEYYKPLRNAYLCLFLLAAAGAIVHLSALIPAAALLVPIAGYQQRILKYCRESQIQD